MSIPRSNPTGGNPAVDKYISTKLPVSKKIVDSGLVEDFDVDEPSAEQHQLITSEMDLLQRKSSSTNCGLSPNPKTTTSASDIADSGLCVEPTDSELIKNLDSSPSPLQDDEELWKECYCTPDINGDTQLHAAILGNSESSALTRAIANIIRLAPESRWLDARNDVGQCAMHVAAITKQPDVIWQLRAAGANPSIRDICGNTPLHLACVQNDLASIRALTKPIESFKWQQLEYPPRFGLLPSDTSIRNYNGDYCVHIAAENSNCDVLRHLVHSCGADLNAREGRSGLTALHIACQQKDARLLAFLLSECLAQLQLETRTYGRLTAYQMADKMLDKSAMEALRRCGAQTFGVSSSESDEESGSDESL